MAGAAKLPAAAAKKSAPVAKKAPPPTKPPAKPSEASGKKGPDPKPEKLPAAPAAGSSTALADAAQIQQRAVVNEALRQRAAKTPTGEYYEGGIDPQGRRHGRGTLTWANGNQYSGDWVAGRMTGNALFTYGGQGGDVYEGLFLNDKKHGQGQYVFANGNTYVGMFENDKRHGPGEYHWVCGDRYVGEWAEGKMHGQGVTTYANGNQYIGSFKEDRRDGKGRLVCVDGLSFDGEWRNNMRNGHGVLTFPNGDTYAGAWLDDQKHGKGVDTFVNGNRFEGMYARNQKAGVGVMTFANGDVYEGEWQEDTMHGRGTYRFSNGFVYEGQWQSDLRHGVGVYKYNNVVYQGEWWEDKRHGKGVMTVDDGAEVYKGTWKAGKMEGLMEVTVTRPFVVGYVGEWRAGQACGTGTFTFESGAQFEGKWDNRQLKAKAKHDVLNLAVEIAGEPPDPQVAFKKASDDALERRVNDQVLLIEVLQREKSDLQQQLTSAKEDRLDRQRQEEQVASLERALLGVREDLAAAVAREAAAGQAGRDAQAEAQRWQRDTEALRQQLGAVQRQLADLHAQAQAREKALTDMQQQAEAAARSGQGERAALEARAAALQTECAAAAARCSGLEALVAEHRAALDAERRAKAQLQAAVAQAVDGGQEAAALRSALQAAQEAAARVAGDLQTCQGELSSVRRTLTDREHQWAAELAKATDWAAEQARQVAALSAQVADLQQRLAAPHPDVAPLQQQVAELQRRLADAHAAAAPPAAEAAAEAETRAARAAVAQLEAEVAGLRQQLVAAAGRAEEAVEAAAVADLRSEAMRERDHKISALELQVAALTKGNAAVTAELAEAQQWARRMKDEAAAAQESSRRLEASLAESVQYVYQLEQGRAELLEQVRALRDGGPRGGSTAQERMLLDQVADLQAQLQDLELDRRQGAEGLALQMGLLDQLREAKGDAEADLRAARQEITGLTEQLAQEKKRRKRAEKLMNGSGDISAESYKNQVIHLKAELEKSTAMVASLQCQLDTRDEKANYRQYRGGGGDGRSPNPQDSVYDRKVQELILKMEEKDKLLQYQAEEIRKMTQLESQLQIARDKLEVMSASTEINGMKEMTRMLSAQAQMDTRYLLSLAPSERASLLSRDVMRRSSSDLRRLLPRPTEGPARPHLPNSS